METCGTEIAHALELLEVHALSCGVSEWPALEWLKSHYADDAAEAHFDLTIKGKKLVLSCYMSLSLSLSFFIYLRCIWHD